MDNTQQTTQVNQRDYDVVEFVKSLNIAADDPHIAETRLAIENILLLKDDPWAARQAMFGLANGCENQVQYLGARLLPNFERRLNVLAGRGVLSENDIAESWFANEDKPHVNDDITIEDQIDDVKMKIDNVMLRMRNEAIEYVLFVRQHDELSRDLEQITYGEIKQRAQMNRMNAMRNRNAA